MRKENNIIFESYVQSLITGPIVDIEDITQRITEVIDSPQELAAQLSEAKQANPEAFDTLIEKLVNNYPDQLQAAVDLKLAEKAN